jgi:hypothetical protein
MQNKEVDEVSGKKVQFTLFMEPEDLKTTGEHDPDLMQFTEKSVGQAHTVLWFDPKMKNYQLFIEYLAE